MCNRNCNCYRCYVERTHPSKGEAFLALLALLYATPVDEGSPWCERCKCYHRPTAEHISTAVVQGKTCPLCGGTSQRDCAENDCDNDWSDFWMPEDPTPWCTGCGAMTQAKCKCGPIANNH